MDDVKEEEMRREVWRGAILIQFELTQNEITTLQPPNPFYLLAPRNSYLPLVATGAKKHFSSSAPTITGEIWYEYKGKPLKWHYPIGVLYDLYGNQELPWQLVVHFQGFPSDQLLRCPNEDTIKWQFMNVLKEANYIKHGDTSRVNGLTVVESNDIWDGVKQFDFDKFWKSNVKLLADGDAKHVPVRLLQSNSPVCTQELIKGDQKTLGAVLCELLPSVFTTPDTLPPHTQILIQGITPSLDSPIAYLSKNLSHPDNFLYICIVNS